MYQRISNNHNPLPKKKIFFCLYGTPLHQHIKEEVGVVKGAAAVYSCWQLECISRVRQQSHHNNPAFITVHKAEVVEVPLAQWNTLQELLYTLMTLKVY